MLKEPKSERWEVAAMLAFMEDCLERSIQQATRGRSPAIDAVVCDFAIRVSEMRAELASYGPAPERRGVSLAQVQDTLGIWRLES